ncbi:hypothetical protein [Sphingobium algorifonticola]|uniref:Uncharacterized protein n=1 Tax=Sphingobium algorifonticola TaxID=2008318 RepID=A0A437J8X7_9SPHN|nr:hypothetical protein [Sphingobium algorifonticola]RVT41957.1 hypothetical protein ENE74_06810 [Sphingobium algorifonticola]
MAAFPGSAHACRTSVSPKFEDVSYADVVVIGRVDNYRVIRDEAFRKRMLASPNLPAQMRKTYEDPKQGLLPDYARFDIQVEQVLLGQVSSTLSVTWDNSTFGEPDQMAAGRYLIALRRPNSASPPLRGPSATILPSPGPNALTLLQAPCSRAFIYNAESSEAQSIRRILDARRK